MVDQNKQSPLKDKKTDVSHKHVWLQVHISNKEIFRHKQNNKKSKKKNRIWKKWFQ